MLLDGLIVRIECAAILSHPTISPNLRDSLFQSPGRSERYVHSQRLSFINESCIE